MAKRKRAARPPGRRSRTTKNLGVLLPGVPDFEEILRNPSALAPLPPHKHPWDDFTVECEVGTLHCSFMPAAPHPEGFSGPFQRHFDEHIGLRASFSYKVEHHNGKHGAGWFLRYDRREDGGWAETKEELTNCATEDEANSAAWQRLAEIDTEANRAAVSFLSGPAMQEFLTGLAGQLSWALDDLLKFSCDYTKLFYSDTRFSRQMVARMAQDAERQRQETMRVLEEQTRN